jgi:hypothetical protein
MNRIEKVEPDFRLPEQRPLWVAIGLWGLPNRLSAVAFLWLSLLLTVACAIAGFWIPILWVGFLFIFSSAWYWLAIRWVDEHGGWRK